MSDKQKALAWWDYANFGKVIKFIESKYPKSGCTIKDKIEFWHKSGCPIVKSNNK